MMSKKSLFRISGFLFFLITTSCTWDQMSPTVDCSLEPIQLEILEQIDSDCGVAIGGFTLGVSGGVSPYTFSSEAGTNADGVFREVSAGLYTVLVTDAVDCTNEIAVEVSNTNGVSLNDFLTTEAGCGSFEGSVEVVATGGTEPYLFSIDGGSTQQSNVFSGLTNGSHTVNIRDQEGCEVTGNVHLSSGVSFKNTVEGIIQNRCTRCHGVSASPSFGSYEEIKTHANRIMARTGAKTMPPDETIPQDEIDAIACWVNDGALSN